MVSTNRKRISSLSTTCYLLRPLRNTINSNNIYSVVYLLAHSIWKRWSGQGWVTLECYSSSFILGNRTRNNKFRFINWYGKNSGRLLGLFMVWSKHNWCNRSPCNATSWCHHEAHISPKSVVSFGPFANGLQVTLFVRKYCSHSLWTNYFNTCRKSGGSEAPCRKITKFFHMRWSQ